MVAIDNIQDYTRKYGTYITIEYLEKIIQNMICIILMINKHFQNIFYIEKIVKESVLLIYKHCLQSTDVSNLILI